MAQHPGRLTRDRPVFRAPWWLPGGHAQTLWRKFTPAPGLTRRRQRLELDDGDFLDLDWHECGAPRAPRRPLVVILHGLCGCSASPYVLALQNHLAARGQDSVAMNLRGCSGEPNRLAHSYHSGCSDDLDAVVRSLPADRPLALVGYSLGANVVVKWLGETGEADDRIVAAVSVSNPFSLARCCDRMIHGRLSRWYGQYFLRQLCRDVREKRQWFARRGRSAERERLDALGDLAELQHIRDFDERVTAPLNGFADADDYYRQCSSERFVASVRVPLLILHAVNDPIIPPDSLPGRGAVPRDAVRDIHDDGGHVGFVMAGHRDWLEQRIADHIDPGHAGPGTDTTQSG